MIWHILHDARTGYQVLRRFITLATLCGCTGLTSCITHRFERNFILANPAATRNERLRQYSLEDQYRIFRYGDHLEPPLMGLAEPIAERGASAIPFLLAKLNTKHDDSTVIDILLIFQTMTWKKSYDVKGDRKVMAALRTSISGMKSEFWRSSCSRRLQEIVASGEAGAATK